MNSKTEGVSQPQDHVGGFSEKFLTFHLAGEEYGIEIMKVQEILGVVPITLVPTAPAYCRGVINLRRRVIPTIDLRLKLGLQALDDTERTCIIIVEVQGQNGQNLFGLVVDEVAEVLDIARENINPTPEYGGSFDVTLIHGIGVVDGETKILLDIDQVFSGEDLPTNSA